MVERVLPLRGRAARACGNIAQRALYKSDLHIPPPAVLQHLLHPAHNAGDHAGLGAKHNLQQGTKTMFKDLISCSSRCEMPSSDTLNIQQGPGPAAWLLQA